MFKSLYVFLLTALFFLPVCAEQTQPLDPIQALFADKIIIPFQSGTIEVDGELSEPQWQQATRVALTYEVYPDENAVPPVKTEAYVFENGTTLYVGFKAFDANPENIAAHYRDRDLVWGDDVVGIKLDTFNDSRLAYQFFVNPLGIQIDSIENEMTGRESASWDAIWQSDGQITDDGYVVEMAIPLNVLNFAEGERNKVWGAEFVRFYPRSNNYRLSNLPRDRNNSCTLCQLGDVEGFENATQGQNLAIIPTLVVSAERTRDPLDTFDWDYDNNQEVGIDVKWGITPEVSFQATLNPDFSQVEADSAQLSINNNFALFFAEQRPFFLENADYFSSWTNLVYTRNISAPDFGAKVTGRIDDHTVGVFVANDQQTNFILPGNLSSSVATLEEKSVNAALRYRYDVSDAFSVGLVSTLRQAADSDYHNYVNAVDMKYLITEQDTLRAQFSTSQTQYPLDLYKEFCDNECATDEDFSETASRTLQQDAFSDNAYRVEYRHRQRDWNFRAAHFSTGGDFRSDLGFQSTVDRTTSVIGGGYYWYSETSWWNRINVWGDWDITHNDQGQLLEKEEELNFSINGPLQLYFGTGVRQRTRVGLRHNNTLLDIDGNTDQFVEQSAYTSFYIRPTNALRLRLHVRRGDQIDFDNNRLGKQTYIEPEINWSIGRHLQLGLKHKYSRLDAEQAEVFTANLTDARITYQFDQRQFLRLTLIYSDIYRNQANYLDEVDSTSENLGVQLLYSYKLNPLTKFFVGYAQNGFADDTLSDLTQDAQSVFMKFSYAWLR
ncbi:carbohydrate binding family 9 domain-containing protein [Aestuariibacter salexigens]|uniref:carbohydrate binding family 9 domain-containing protein n=1 Tax=Aestuariibacter salexigens TaxID=226010 RepID=UPI0004799114|nr:carbohydrate binding family 9 domain-containing protein [Aestuariibacter salexigens]